MSRPLCGLVASAPGGASVLITCWSSKGGSGTTVVAAALAALVAADSGDALLVDLGGDIPAALGLPESAMGLSTLAPPDGELLSRAHIRRLIVDAGGGVRLLPRGPGRLDADVVASLAPVLAGPEVAVVDAGVADPGTAAFELAAAATRSLLVLRPCFLALRRAVAAPLRASGIVLVDEPHRVLGPGDVEAALGVPVVATVPWDPAIARRVDAGLLAAGLPRSLARSLRHVAGVTTTPPAPVIPLRPEALR